MSIGLNDYTFRLNDAGVTLNTDSTIPFVDIDNVSGLDTAPYRETIRDHEGTDGSFIDAEFEKGRDVILNGTIYANTSNVESYLDSLKVNYAPVTSPIPFYFKTPGLAERVMFVKSRGVRYDWETARRIGITRAQFLLYAEDPRIYDSTLQSIIIPYGGSAGNGFAFSFGFNLDFGGGATPAGVNITNSGNRSTPAVMTIQGPIENPLIANDTTGNVLNFIILLGASDTLTVNLLNRTVVLNDTANRRSALTTPSWFFINPGTNFIRFGGNNGTGSQLTVAFRSAWR